LPNAEKESSWLKKKGGWKLKWNFVGIDCLIQNFRGWGRCERLDQKGWLVDIFWGKFGVRTERGDTKKAVWGDVKLGERDRDRPLSVLKTTSLG